MSSHVVGIAPISITSCSAFNIAGLLILSTHRTFAGPLIPWFVVVFSENVVSQWICVFHRRIPQQIPCNSQHKCPQNQTSDHCAAIESVVLLISRLWRIAKWSGRQSTPSLARTSGRCSVYAGDAPATLLSMTCLLWSMASAPLVPQQWDWLSMLSLDRLRVVALVVLK